LALNERRSKGDAVGRNVGIAVGMLLAGIMVVAPAVRAQGSSAGGTPGEALTDPQIAAIVIAANQADIDAATLAKSRSKNKDVLSFAGLMIKDHSSVNKKAKQLATKLKIKPEETATSRALEKGGKENLAALKKLKGAAFDKAYIDQEVTAHEQVLSTINDKLIPSAQNAELKALLEKVAPVIQAHLDHAKELQGKLSAGTGGAGR
jgi:putative membrane protein